MDNRFIIKRWWCHHFQLKNIGLMVSILLILMSLLIFYNHILLSSLFFYSLFLFSIFYFPPFFPFSFFKKIIMTSGKQETLKETQKREKRSTLELDIDDDGDEVIIIPFFHLSFFYFSSFILHKRSFLYGINNKIIIIKEGAYTRCSEVNE